MSVNVYDNNKPNHLQKVAGKLPSFFGKLGKDFQIKNHKVELTDEARKVNPNLLDNSWFAVNQRGFTTGTYSSTHYYTVDRWKSGGGTITKNDDGTITLSNNGDFYQPIDRDINNLKGEVVTLSIMMADGSIQICTNKVPTSYPSSYEWLPSIIDNSPYYKAGIYSHPSGDSFDFQVSIVLGNNCSIKAIKLEYGDKSTLAQDHAPNYTEELLKCQRYFIRNLFNGDTDGFIIDKTTIRCHTEAPVRMRTNPSVLNFSISWLRVNGGNSSGANLSIASTRVELNPYRNNALLIVAFSGTNFVATSNIELVVANLACDVSADL